MAQNQMSLSKEFNLPPIRQGYKVSESGYILKAKHVRRNNSGVKLPNIEHSWKSQKICSNKENLNSNVSVSNISEKTSKCETDLNKGLNFRYAKTLDLHDDKSSIGPESVITNFSSQYKTSHISGKPVNTCSTDSPRMTESRVSQLHRAKSKIYNGTGKPPNISQMASTQNRRGPCSCILCSSELKEWEYENFDFWPRYPCSNLHLNGTSTISLTTTVDNDTNERKKIFPS